MKFSSLCNKMKACINYSGIRITTFTLPDNLSATDLKESLRIAFW